MPNAHCPTLSVLSVCLFFKNGAFNLKQQQELEFLSQWMP